LVLLLFFLAIFLLAQPYDEPYLNSLERSVREIFLGFFDN
jgi:hypothetical protein